MRTSLAALAVAIVAFNAGAAPIVYEIGPRIAGQPVQLTGTITTDGTIGPLAAANILAWSFVLVDPMRTAVLSSATGTFSAVGSALVGSEDALTFAFDDPFHQGFDDVFVGPPDPFSSARWALAAGVFADGAGLETILSPTVYEDFRIVTDPFAVVGIALPAAVPEPPAVALLGAGLAAVVLGRRRRRAPKR